MTAKICRDGGGWFLPLTPAEQDVDDVVRAVIYGGVMIYFFMGVAVIADCFMDSITKIASSRRQVWLSDGRRSTKKVWNETVATLSLMALGSSAPEIFLSVMDSVKKEFHFGVLGPSTIVGSAAFNLLVIVAVCILAIPSTEVRRIKDLPTFYITVFFSILAYAWLVLILVNISEDQIEIWEALVTLMLFFCLLWVSYKTDVGHFDCVLRRIGLIQEHDPSDSNGCTPPATIALTAEAIHVDGSADEQVLEVNATLSEVFSEYVTCTYHTEALSATPNFDYKEVEGKIEFPPGFTELPEAIRLPILPKSKNRATCKFLLILEEAEGGAEFNPNDDGGSDSAILTVTIASNNPRSTLQAVDRCINFTGIRNACNDWVDQIVSTCYCNGSLEEQREASFTDWFFHILNFPWKILFFTTVPPTSYAGGWISFFISLLWIAVMSAILSDLAEMFGCVCGVPDIMTAITFVALGTSMPDLFASLSAAQADPVADASVVNVTGSNAVNVFLGLGVPWTAGSLYWAIQGRTRDWEERYPKQASEIDGVVFVVDSTNLGFSVLAFILASCGALVLLYMRRVAIGGELGGPFVTKIATAMCFFSFWFGFIAAVSWRSLRIKHYDMSEQLTVIGGVVGFEFCVALVPFFLLLRRCRQKPSHEDNSINGDNGDLVKTDEEETHLDVEVDTPAQPTSGGPSPNRTISTISTKSSRGATWTVDDEVRISVSAGSHIIASLGSLGRGAHVERVPSQPDSE